MIPLLHTLPQRPPPAVSTENSTAGQAGPSAVSTLGAQGFVICFPCVSPHTLPHSLTAQSSPTPSRDRPTHRGECWQGSCVHLPQSWLPAWWGLLWTPLPCYKVGTILPLWTRNLQPRLIQRVKITLKLAAALQRQQHWSFWRCTCQHGPKPPTHEAVPPRLHKTGTTLRVLWDGTEAQKVKYFAGGMHSWFESTGQYNSKVQFFPALFQKPKSSETPHLTALWKAKETQSCF